MKNSGGINGLEIIDENNELGVDLLHEHDFTNQNLDLESKSTHNNEPLPRNLNEIPPEMIVTEPYENDENYENYEQNEQDEDDDEQGNGDDTQPQGGATPGQGDNGSVSSYVGSDLSPEEEMRKKKNLLYTLKRFQKKGFTLSRNYNLNSDLFEMKAEVDSIKREANLDATVATMKKGLTISTYLLEMLNNQFDPINAKLDGWSNQVKDDVDHGDYDEVFEELYDKYSNRFQMPPEMRLASMLGTSALQYHVAQVVVNRTLNNNKTDQILQQNPQIKKDIMNAVNESNVGKEIKMNVGKEQQKMNNPSEIDDILKELQIEDENSKILSTDF